MRPLLIPSSYAPNLGGVEEVSGQLALGLVGAGHHPAVLTNRWPKALPVHETIDGVPVVRRSFRVPHPSVRGIGSWLLFSAATRRSVVEVARAAKADVVNLHCVSSNATYALSAAKALGVPLVVSVHGELSGDSGRVYDRSALLRRNWHNLLDSADAVTAPSAYSLAEAEAFYGKPLPNPRIVRNGIDLELFTDPRSEASEPFVLAAGRLVENKGFDLLIDVWHRIPRAAGTPRLIIAGDGPHRTELERRAATSPVGDRIHLVGRLSRFELATRMKAASAFILASRAEALGLVLLEAMAARTPVVASAVGGIPEIVQDGVTGLLFAPDDSAALLDRIVDVLTDDRAAQRRVEAAVASVASFTWSACTDEYLGVFREAVTR